MLIDWFTVGAQVLNFLILVWVMKHFLYQPILNAIDAREKKIDAELADAATKKAEAKKDRDEFQHKNEEFDQQRAALFTKATDEAKAERQRLLDDARKAADALSAKRSEALKNDAKNLNQAVVRRAQEEVFSIARKTLTDLATTSLEERMGAVFTRRLRELDGQAKEALGAALKKAAEPAVVRSAFDLPAEERAKIQNAINETFSADIHLRFETAPDRIGGIELTANGQKVAWSIADYLTSLEKGVGELLKQQGKPEPKPAPKPDAKPEPKPEAKSEPKADPKPAAPVPAASEVKSGSASKTEPTPKSDTDAKEEPKTEAKPEAATKPEADAKTHSTPAANVEPDAQPTALVKVQQDVKSEPTMPKTEAAPKPEAEPAAETKAAATPGAEAKAEPKTGTAPKPEADVKPQSKSAAKVAPDAEPAAPAKAVPEVKPEPTKPPIEAAPKPEAKAEPATKAEAAPPPVAKPEQKAAAKPDTEPAAKPEPAEAATVQS